ncbi:MAG: RHS repeat-associated core domain-containing protein [Chlamydiota bacterium]
MMFIFLRLLFCLLPILCSAEEEFSEELFLSTPDQLSALRGEPEYLAGGLVSPMSGQLCLRQTDLTVKGAQEIFLTRVYIPPSILASFASMSKNQEAYDKQAMQTHLAKTCKGWQFFPHLRLQFDPTSKEVRLSDVNGATFDFRLEGSQTILASPILAISNVSGEKPSGKYDPLGRTISRTIHEATINGWEELEKEYYLYQGDQEVGAFSEGKLKNAKVLGLGLPIGIELEGQVFAPILDVQGNICKLIDFNGAIADSYVFTAFGEEVKISTRDPFNPWRFASKRFEPELSLICFGKRYYDPEFAKWTTTDPAGFIDSSNLYQYVFNNPFRYADPDGRFAFVIPILIWGAEIALPSLSAYVIPFIYGAAIGAVAYTGYKTVEFLNENSMAKNVDVYAPDRELPQTEKKKGGIPIPDTDAPHTQLGTKKSERGDYPKAREFDKDGNPIRDIDFTDHGRGHDHTCPHQHRKTENSTGGTSNRYKAEPVPEWRYE